MGDERDAASFNRRRVDLNTLTGVGRITPPTAGRRRVQLPWPEGVETNEGFTEQTMFKVYDALRTFGLSEEGARGAIDNMLEKGILFRERVTPTPKTQICRGEPGEERMKG